MSLKKPAVSGVLVVAAVAGIGTSYLMLSHAATSAYATEAESGALSGCAARVADPGASGDGAVKFAGSCLTAGSAGPGAHLPIRYALSSLSGTQRFVATNGNDSTGNGSINAPYATLAKAIAAAASGDSVVIRGGIYRQGNITVPANKTLQIVAYPGEIPVFDGAFALPDAWVAEGGLKYHAYTPMPATDGSGISFTSGQNLNGDGMGKYPDQAWTGSTMLDETNAKSGVTNDSFYVDRANHRLYVTAANANSGAVEASWKNVFMQLSAPHTTVRGLRIMRYSDTANNYGVFRFNSTADYSTLQDDEFSGASFYNVYFAGSSDLLTHDTMKNVTITDSNYMGVSAVLTDYLTLDSVNITHMNLFDEFTYSPESGALKATRTRYSRVLNSNISDNHSHGLWFDQSNYQTDIANNTVLDNYGTGIFYEISDDLLLVNNYVRASGGARAVKLSGSSGLKLVNNTIIGGADAVGIYTDSRSIPGCADPAHAVCAGSYNSDRDSIHPHLGTIDWIPRIDMMIDNIIAYPTANGYCGGSTALCITNHNGPATVANSAIVHKADSWRPQTIMAGNVYANGSGRIAVLGGNAFSTASSFGSWLAGATGIGGLEAGSLSGNSYVNADGSPTSVLSAIHSKAAATPTDSRINAYVPAGSRHFGVLNK